MTDEHIGIVDARSNLDKSIAIPVEVLKIGYGPGSLYLLYLSCQMHKRTYTHEQMLIELEATEEQLERWHKVLVERGLLTK